MADLTKSELRILQALDAAPDKIGDFQNLRKTAGLTQRGFRIVLHRLEDANLIGRCENIGMNFTLTFGGMRALKEAA